MQPRHFFSVSPIIALFALLLSPLPAHAATASQLETEAASIVTDMLATISGPPDQISPHLTELYAPAVTVAGRVISRDAVINLALRNKGAGHSTATFTLDPSSTQVACVVETGFCTVTGTVLVSQPGTPALLPLPHANRWLVQFGSQQPPFRGVIIGQN